MMLLTKANRIPMANKKRKKPRSAKMPRVSMPPPGGPMAPKPWMRRKPKYRQRWENEE